MDDLERLQKAHEKLGSPTTYFTKKSGVNISKEQFIKEAANMTEHLVKLKESGNNILFDENGGKIISRIEIKYEA